MRERDRSKLDIARDTVQIYWDSLSDRHSWVQNPGRIKVDEDFFRLITQHNDSLRILSGNLAENSIKLMESLFPGCGVVVKECSDGRNSLILLEGPAFRGIKGPGGMIRMTPLGSGQALSSQALAREINDTVKHRNEPLLIEVAHTSKLSPIGHGCAAEYADYVVENSTSPNATELSGFIWKKLQEPREAVNRLINLQRRCVGQEELNNCLVTAIRNTDDMSLCFSGGEQLFDIGEFCLSRESELQRVVAVFNRKNNMQVDTEKFRKLTSDANEIATIENLLAKLCFESVHNPGDLFVNRFRTFIERSNTLRGMSISQQNGLIAYALRNLYLTHLLGYVYENDKNNSKKDFYPSHPYSHHKEDAFCISREGLHLGAFVPGLQFMLSTPESDQEAISDILLLAGVIKKYSDKESHPLIITDTDEQVLKRYMICILQNPKILELFESGFLYPYPVLLKPGEGRKIQKCGIVM